MRRIFSPDFTLTKRQLGFILSASGVLLIVIMLAAELLDAQSGGFGMVQQLGVVVGVLSLVAGLALLPLGSQPA
ncbi:MAG: hypothetical protein GXY36_20330 [Chloroflexi bacterium]|nr:hypothetical protein [Chloroflexota bacterium]